MLFSEGLGLDQKHRIGNRMLWQGLGEARYNLGRWDLALEAYQVVCVEEVSCSSLDPTKMIVDLYP